LDVSYPPGPRPTAADKGYLVKVTGAVPESPTSPEAQAEGTTMVTVSPCLGAAGSNQNFSSSRQTGAGDGARVSVGVAVGGVGGGGGSGVDVGGTRVAVIVGMGVGAGIGVGDFVTLGVGVLVTSGVLVGIGVYVGSGVLVGLTSGAGCAAEPVQAADVKTTKLNLMANSVAK
jgi:hypothetical protein